jgi:hypothetical protein
MCEAGGPASLVLLVCSIHPPIDDRPPKVLLGTVIRLFAVEGVVMVGASLPG